MQVPHWGEVLEMSRRVSKPSVWVMSASISSWTPKVMLLEANATRLAIQIANARGLYLVLPRLTK